VSRKNTIADFWKRVDPLFMLDPEVCWDWEGCINGNGYGSIRFNGGGYGAHQLSWIIHNGPIPPGICVCHTCDNRKCVNPGHLFLGTQSENIRDMVSKGRHFTPWLRLWATHCRWGHPYNEVNTRVVSSGYRQCRACDSINQKRYRKMKRR